ncbi:diguanylate cyclase [Peptococcaceae bacterium]|nr:diguanylate cyclase [Peptococcaceae bacterium]
MAKSLLVTLPKTQGSAAVQVLNRFHNAFNKATISGNLKVKNITVSAGIAQHPVDGEDVKSLLKTADSNLYKYKAKNSGRNRVEWLSSDLEQTSSMQIS